MSLEFSSDSERMEQWASTAKLRRHEVERIEALLADATEPLSFPRPVCSEAVERIDRLGETGWQAPSRWMRAIWAVPKKGCGAGRRKTNR
jgi:hypothetical protein